MVSMLPCNFHQLVQKGLQDTVATKVTRNGKVRLPILPPDLPVADCTTRDESLLIHPGSFLLGKKVL